MKRFASVWLALLWLMPGIPQAFASHPAAIPARATLKAIKAVDAPAGKEIILQIEGEYSFQSIRTPEGSNYIDLQGARVGGIPRSAQWGTAPLAGYQLLEYTDASGFHVVRVEILTHTQEQLVVTRERSGLRLVIGQDGPASSMSPKPPAEAAASSPGEAQEKPLIVSGISVKPGAEGGVAIDVATTGTAPIQILRLANPDRLVVDLEGARNQVSRRSIPVTSPLVRNVRVGQFQAKDPGVVRVVADLEGDPVFEAHAFPDRVHIEVKPHSTGRAVPEDAAPQRESVPGREEGKPAQQEASTRQGREPSQVETHSEPAKERVSRNSITAASPSAKDVKAGKPPEGNPQGAPAFDDVLRYLFGQGAPTAGVSAAPAKGPESSPAKPSDGPSSVSDVSVKRGSAGDVIIDVVITKSSAFQAFRVEHPDRYVLDVRGAKNQAHRSSVPVASPLVKSVRVGQFMRKNPDVVRVVVDLSGGPLCSAHPFPGGVRIEVKPRPMAAASEDSRTAGVKAR